MNNYNNNLIVPSITRELRGNAATVFGSQEIPSGFFSLRNRVFISDFMNLFNHSWGLMRRNAANQDNHSLAVLRSASLDPTIQNDQFVIDFMNRTSFFNIDIMNYKNEVRRIVDSGLFSQQFFALKDASKSLTDSILKTIYYTGGIDGVNLLNNNLGNVIIGNFNPDCLKIYNIIIYTAPFVLIDAAQGNAFSQLAFFYSPYELIAAHLQAYSATFVYEDLTFLMKLQMKLEQNLPEIKLCKQLYSTLLMCYAAQRRIGTIAVLVALPTVGLVKYLPLILSSPENAGATTSAVVVPRAGGSGEDIIFQILFDIINN